MKSMLVLRTVAYIITLSKQLIFAASSDLGLESCDGFVQSVQELY